MKPNEHLLVQDLLPSYVDGLTCSETSAYVQTHLQTCEVCRASCEAMQHPLPPPPAPPAEVRYLKRLRGYLAGNLIWVFLLVGCLFGFSLQSILSIPPESVHVETICRLSSGKIYAELSVDPPYSAADLPFRTNSDMVDINGNISLTFSTSLFNYLAECARGAQASPAVYTYIFDPAVYDLPQTDFLSLHYSKIFDSAPPTLLWQGELLPPAPAEIEAQWNDYRGNSLAQWRKVLSQQFAAPQ